MINSFSQFLVEEEKVVYFTFGRMNPPTIGHGKLLDKLSSMAGRNPYKVFLSQSTDANKNPLSYSDKVKHVRKMFPKHARNVMINKNVRTAIEVLVELYNQGFRKVVMVVGSDRVTEFDVLLNKYNGKQARHGFYNFADIKVASAGERDPDADGVEGMSASKMRGFAKDNDFVSFSQGVPASMSNSDTRRLFNDVRKGMGLKEEKSFKRHIQLAPVSEIREAYIKDGLFEVGDDVVMLKNDDRVGTIQYLGANYVVVESKGETWRCWLNDVSKVDDRTDQYGNVQMDYDEADYGATPELGPYRLSESKSMYADKPDWGTPESSAKAKKMTPGEQQEANDTHKTKDGKTAKKGLWYNIHQRRKKGLPPKKPGQKGYPKTLNIEQNDIERAREIIAKDKEQARDMIAKEKQKDKLKHDRLLDRARRASMLRKNRGVKS